MQTKMYFSVRGGRFSNRRNEKGKKATADDLS